MMRGGRKATTTITMTVTASPSHQNTASINHSSYYWSSVALIVGIPAVGDFLFGFDIGATSYAVSIWKQFLDPLWIGILVAAPSSGALIAGFAVFGLSDRIGGRQELQLAALLYIVGAILESLSGAPAWLVPFGDGSTSAPVPKSLRLCLLLMGRWIYGSGVAFGLHGATTYVGEMAPSSIRGPIMSLNEVSVVAGILGGYLVGYLCNQDTSSAGWAPLYWKSLILSLPMLVLSSTCLHESARWLVLKGRTEEALESLRWLYEPEAASQQHRQLLQARSSSQLTSSQSSISYKALLLEPAHRPALRAGLGLVALLQLTGQPTVLSYASPLLQEAGLAASSAVLVAVFKIVITLIAVFTVEQQGRKTLLIAGCSFMLTGLVVLTSTFSTSQNEKTSITSDKWHNTLVLAAMFVYIGGYQIGFGTMVWLITTEIFSNATIRGPAVALCVQTNFFLHALVELLVPVLAHYFGSLAIVFGLFGVATACSIAFIHRYIPETKGLSLEEIEEQLRPTTALISGGEYMPILDGTFA